MNVDIIKEACIEYCENVYALIVGYLSKNDNNELKTIIDKVYVIVNDIRKCNDVNKLLDYKKNIVDFMGKVEGIINE